MKRVGAVWVIAALAVAVFIGCEEDTANVEETGFAMSFENCLPVGVLVFIDSEYQDFISVEEHTFFNIPAGSYTLEVKSNTKFTGGEEDSFYYWSEILSVSDGRVTQIVLDCTGAMCPDTAETD